jgi:hypothetical protein
MMNVGNLTAFESMGGIIASAFQCTTRFEATLPQVAMLTCSLFFGWSPARDKVCRTHS